MQYIAHKNTDAKYDSEESTNVIIILPSHRVS